MFIEHGINKYLKAPAGRHVPPGYGKIGRWQSEVESVGVGSPNPLGGETPPLRWMSHLEFWCIAAFSPRGAKNLRPPPIIHIALLWSAGVGHIGIL